MISLPVVEASQVGAARRRALNEAHAVGLSDDDSDRLAIIVTEVATNLFRHAKEGEILLLAGCVGSRGGLTVIGLDVGPGIANVEAALTDGFTTAGEGGKGIGGGLGAIRRLADAFDIYSDDKGTSVLATVFGPNAQQHQEADVGAIIISKPGFEEGGDAFAIRYETDATMILLVDVLGHGAIAAEEARKAAAAFEAGSGTSIDAAHRAVTEALEGGRGAAALIVRLPRDGGLLEGIGLGNVRGEIVGRDGSRRGIPCAPGIVGAHGKAPRLTEHEWPHGAVLVMSTDGLRGASRAPEPPALFMRESLTVAATIYKRRRRGSDDSGIVVARCAG